MVSIVFQVDSEEISYRLKGGFSGEEFTKKLDGMTLAVPETTEAVSAAALAERRCIVSAKRPPVTNGTWHLRWGAVASRSGWDIAKKDPVSVNRRILLVEAMGRFHEDNAALLVDPTKDRSDNRNLLVFVVLELADLFG